MAIEETRRNSDGRTEKLEKKLKKELEIVARLVA